MHKKLRKGLLKAMKRVAAGKMNPGHASAISALADSATRSMQVQVDSKRR